MLLDSINNNVFVYLQARAYDEVTVYAIVAGTVGQALPAGGLERAVAASQTSSLNFDGVSYVTERQLLVILSESVETYKRLFLEAPSWLAQFNSVEY